MKEVITKDMDLKHIALMCKSRIEVFPDITGKISFFEEVPAYDKAMYVNKKAKCDEASSLQLLKEVSPILEGQEDFSNDALFETLSAFGKDKGYKTNFVMWPLRTAMSGLPSTPGGATELMSVLGKEESLKRIQSAIDLLS